MKLSEYKIDAIWNKEKKLYDGELLPFSLIDEIVYNDIDDNNINAKYAIVFGISRKIEMKARVNKAYELYKNGRIKKILFTGSNKGISSKKNNQTPDYINEEVKDISEIYEDDLTEAERMKNYALSLGIKNEDIIIDIKSNNSIETLTNAKKILNLKDNDSLILITSAYHMKRCYLGALKFISNNINYGLVIAETGYFEKDNYKNTKLGIQLANFDANHLVRQARDGLIFDIEIKKS